MISISFLILYSFLVMRQQKIRKILITADQFFLGVTLPYKKFDHWFNTLVTIRESGNCLILESGCKPEVFSMKEIRKHSTVVEKVVL